MLLFFNLANLIFLLIILFFCNKFNILVDKKIDKHKQFLNTQKNYILGGIVILFFLFSKNIISENYLLSSFYLAMFLIGFSSDLKIFNNPKKRFLIQFLIILIFTALIDLKITSSTRLAYLDIILQNEIFHYFFVSFCLMVLINGANFIDGINTNLTSYVIIILSFLLLGMSENLHNIETIKGLIFLLSVFYFFNLFGKVILGDSGAYLISMFLGIFLINFSSNNELISPFFIILLLWYPCFELLFSMLRRYYFKKDSYYPDTIHLHQILLEYYIPI